MNLKDLAAYVAAQQGISKDAATDMVKTVLAGLEKGLTTGKKRVRLDGFGTFSLLERKSRDYVSPTGKEVTLPATVRVKFKAHADLHNAVV